MPITLSPAKTTVDAGGTVAFTARVTGGSSPVTLVLQGPRGTPLPQSRTIASGTGSATFAPVRFTAGSTTATTVTCAASNGSVGAAVSTVTIVVAAPDLLELPDAGVRSLAADAPPRVAARQTGLATSRALALVAQRVTIRVGATAPDAALDLATDQPRAAASKPAPVRRAAAAKRRPAAKPAAPKRPPPAKPAKTARKPTTRAAKPTPPRPAPRRKPAPKRGGSR